jgi:tetratricopeptide (TPR) repeat protein
MFSILREEDRSSRIPEPGRRVGVRHLSVDLVLMVVQGLLPPRVLVLLMFEHLKELCDECRASLALLGSPGEEFFDAQAARREPAQPPDPRYASLVSKAGQGLLEWAHRMEEERRQAEADLRTLLRVPRREREPRIRRARTHFLSRSFAELLLKHSWEIVATRPVEAAELAALVPVVLDRIPGIAREEWAESLRLRALAHRANALRVRGELPDSDRLFAELRRQLALAISNDAELHAEVSSLEASLRLNQRRLDEAERLLDRAVLLYREQRDAEQLARALVKRGAVHQVAGDLLRAVEDLRQALQTSTDVGDAGLRTRVCAISNLALCLCDLGRFGEARQLVEENRELYRSAAGAWEGMRLPWLEGIIARGLGETATAESHFLRSRNLFLEHGFAFNGALVCLDLALLYLDSGRHSELRRVARLIEPILRTRGLHREASAALLLFQQAATGEMVTRESVLSLRRYLEDARKDPLLKFQAPRQWKVS